MNLAIVTPFCDPGAGGGIATHVRSTAAALSRAGAAVTVVSGRRDRMPPPIAGAELVVVEGGDAFDPVFWKASAAAVRDLHARRPLHAALCEGSSGQGVLGLGIPIVAMAHQFKLVHILNSWREVAGARSLASFAFSTVPRALYLAAAQERPFYASCDRVVCGAEHMASLVKRWYRLPRVEVAANAVDPAKYRGDPEARAAIRRRWGAGELDFVFLIAGRLQATKGADFGVRAFLRAFPREPRVRLVVVGEGRHRPAVEREASRGAGRIRLDGELSESDLIAAYQGADALIMPSVLLEVVPYVLLEGMASGLAIAAADRPSSREALGDAGVYFPPHNEAAAAAALLELYRNAELRRSMRQAAFHRVVERFDPERTAEILMRLIREAAE